MIVGDRLLALDHADRLAGHDRAALDIAVDHRAAQRARPIMLDLQLGLGHLDLAFVELLRRPRAAWRRNCSVSWFLSARTGMTGRRGSIWTDGIASRAEARMNAFLKLAWAMHSVAQTKRVPSWTPDRAHFEIGGDRLAAADPAGDEHRDVFADVGRISCASTEVETGPIWPPASMPSITSASTPERISFLASASAGAKPISFAPLALIRSIAPPGGKPAASTTWPT